MDASAAKLIGAGLATIALAGVGVGIGNIFGSFVAGVGQPLLVSRDQGAGFLVGLLGRVEIALDLGLTLVQRVGDRGHREPRHHQIEGHEGDREPDELRCEAVDVELRHAARPFLRQDRAARQQHGEAGGERTGDRSTHVPRTRTGS